MLFKELSLTDYLGVKSKLAQLFCSAALFIDRVKCVSKSDYSMSLFQYALRIQYYKHCKKVKIVSYIPIEKEIGMAYVFICIFNVIASCFTKTRLKIPCSCRVRKNRLVFCRVPQPHTCTRVCNCVSESKIRCKNA